MNEVVIAGLDFIREGVVEQAFSDLFAILSGFEKPTDDVNLMELNRFFHSHWFEMLCDYDPEYLIDKVIERADKMHLIYDIAKEKGSAQYHIITIADGQTVPHTFGKKKDVVRKAEVLNDMTTKEFQRCRLRDKKAGEYL